MVCLLFFSPFSSSGYFTCSCLDHVEIFPYLREPVVENTTLPEYIFCNQTRLRAPSPTVSPQQNNKDMSSNSSSVASRSSNKNDNINYKKTVSSPIAMTKIGSPASISFVATNAAVRHADDLPPHEFIYSSGKIFAIRLRFLKLWPAKIDNWYLNVTAEYRFLKKGE